MNEQHPIESLRDALRARGEDPDLIGWADDPTLPRIDGVQLVRLQGDGVEVTTWERGREHDHRRYPDESTAAEALRRLFGRFRSASPPSTGEGKAEAAARMQAKARVTLRELAEHDEVENGRRRDP